MKTLKIACLLHRYKKKDFCIGWQMDQIRQFEAQFWIYVYKVGPMISTNYDKVMLCNWQNKKWIFVQCAALIWPHYHTRELCKYQLTHLKRTIRNNQNIFFLQYNNYNHGMVSKIKSIFKSKNFYCLYVLIDLEQPKLYFKCLKNVVITSKKNV